MKSKGMIKFDDDIVVVYKPDWSVEWKGMYDYCPYKGMDMSYDKVNKWYKVVNPGNESDYRIIAKWYMARR